MKLFRTLLGAFFLISATSVWGWQAQTPYGFVRSVVKELGNTVKTNGVKSEKQSAPVENKQALRFTPDPAVRRRYLEDLIGRMQGDPGVTAYYQEHFSASDPLESAAKIMAPLGLRSDDVADALTYFVVTHWMAANKQIAYPTARQIAPLRERVAHVLLKRVDDPNFTNQMKQEGAEYAMSAGMFVSLDSLDTNGEPARLVEVSARIKSQIDTMGLDLATLELGPNGFEVAK